jgi:hypothetical protein
MSLNSLLGRRFTSSFRVNKKRVQEFISVLNEGNPDEQNIHRPIVFKPIVPPAFAVVYLFQTVKQLFADPVFKSKARCVLHGEQKVEFENVVQVGDIINTTMTVGSINTKSLRQEPSQDFMELHFVSRNQHKEVVTRATTILILRADIGDE